MRRWRAKAACSLSGTVKHKTSSIQPLSSPANARGITHSGHVGGTSRVAVYIFCPVAEDCTSTALILPVLRSVRIYGVSLRCNSRAQREPTGALDQVGKPSQCCTRYYLPRMRVCLLCGYPDDCSSIPINITAASTYCTMKDCIWGGPPIDFSFLPNIGIPIFL